MPENGTNPRGLPIHRGNSNSNAVHYGPRGTTRSIGVPAVNDLLHPYTYDVPAVRGIGISDIADAWLSPFGWEPTAALDPMDVGTPFQFIPQDNFSPGQVGPQILNDGVQSDKLPAPTLWIMGLAGALVFFVITTFKKHNNVL